MIIDKREREREGHVRERGKKRLFESIRRHAAQNGQRGPHTFRDEHSLHCYYYFTLRVLHDWSKRMAEIPSSDTKTIHSVSNPTKHIIHIHHPRRSGTIKGPAQRSREEGTDTSRYPLLPGVADDSPAIARTHATFIRLASAHAILNDSCSLRRQRFMIPDTFFKTKAFARRNQGKAGWCFSGWRGL